LFLPYSSEQRRSFNLGQNVFADFWFSGIVETRLRQTYSSFSNQKARFKTEGMTERKSGANKT
jgi:hypothetical protein